MDHLLPVTVNDQIFPHVAHGFTDTVSTIRELTVKVRTSDYVGTCCVCTQVADGMCWHVLPLEL